MCIRDSNGRADARLFRRDGNSPTSGPFTSIFRRVRGLKSRASLNRGSVFNLFPSQAKFCQRKVHADGSLLFSPIQRLDVLIFAKPSTPSQSLDLSNPVLPKPRHICVSEPSFSCTQAPSLPAATSNRDDRLPPNKIWPLLRALGYFRQALPAIHARRWSRGLVGIAP